MCSHKIILKEKVFHIYASIDAIVTAEIYLEIPQVLAVVNMSYSSYRHQNNFSVGR